MTCELWFILIQAQFDSRSSEVKVANENIGLLCSSNGQGHNGGLEFHFMFVDPIFSVPLKYLQPNHVLVYCY